MSWYSLASFANAANAQIASPGLEIRLPSVPALPVSVPWLALTEASNSGTLPRHGKRDLG